MADQGFKRKLSAILSADVKGYSKLMGDDEEATVRTLKAYRAAINDLAEQYRGRIVDSPGDNILAEFNSVVDAVNCAVEIQRELAERNAELAENRKMAFRIGVNLGDVIEEDGRIYGDGVNIAARVESLAEPGAVCISGRAYDQVENKLGLKYESLGEHRVKNIARPIRVYRVLSYPGVAAHRVVHAKKTIKRKWRNIATPVAVAVVVVAVLGIWQFYPRRSSVAPASIEKMAFPLPDKPSIVVLPFDNLSGDPKQEYFCDGITEEIITTLSKSDKLFVIARNSAFTYKGKPVKVKHVAEELGVRYVLEGSVRESENRVRITAQLIDALRGHHLWVERYDRDLKDIFALQDEITRKIVLGLRVNLTEGEQVRMWDKRHKGLDVALKNMEAQSLFRKGTMEGLIRYGEIAKELIDMAPDSPFGYVHQAGYNWSLAIYGKSPEESIAKAFKYAQKAIALDESFAFSHGILGNVYLIMRDYEKAIAEGKRSVELEPNAAFLHMLLGSTLGYAGRLDEGIRHLNQAIRLDPIPLWIYYFHLGRCYRQKGQYEDALTAFEKGLGRSPDSLANLLGLAEVNMLLNRPDGAKAAAKRVLEIDPGFSVKRASKTWPYKYPADTRVAADALRKAGLPE